VFPLLTLAVIEVSAFVISDKAPALPHKRKMQWLSVSNSPCMLCFSPAPLPRVTGRCRLFASELGDNSRSRKQNGVADRSPARIFPCRSRSPRIYPPFSSSSSSFGFMRGKPIPTDLSPVSVDNPYMVYWVRFLTLHRVFLTPGGGLTGVSRRQYLDPRPSVFIRHTPVLPICRSTAADLLRTITVTFSGTIVAEFSASARPPPPKMGESSADCATCKINFYQGHSTADFT
jgi:hypothetical protein